MIEYPLVVLWSDADQAYIADIPDFGCSAWADTPEAALREARAAVADFVADAEAHGTALPSPTPQPTRRRVGQKQERIA